MNVLLNEQEPTSPQNPLRPTPQDPSYYAPRRRAERLGSRLSSLGETQFDGPVGVEGASSPFSVSASLSAQLEDAVSESLRRRLDPRSVPEPVEFTPERAQRHTLLIVAGGSALVLGVAAIVALLLFTVIPTLRGGGEGSSSGVAASIAQPPESNQAKPASSQFRSLSGESDPAVTRGEAERLLQKFVRWGQKTDSAQQQR